MNEKKLKFNSKVIHGGQAPDKAYGAVSAPIYQTSTFAKPSPTVNQEFEYSRGENPTRAALERALVSIEDGTHAMAFASGVAAIDAILRLLNAGDEVIAINDLYGGSYRLFTKVFERYNISFHFVKMDDVSNIEKHINDKTKLVWIETPTNPLLTIVDITKIASITKKHNLLLAVDNTFASPYLQQPLTLGADIVMHSISKYISGHSDVISGAVIVNDKEIADKLYFIQKSTGAISGPMDSFLALRGLKTLHVRMQRHCENTAVIARFLEKHDKVEKVFWPGFESHPNHKVAKEQMKDFGAVISFVPKGGNFDDAVKIVETLNLFALADSLGGVESLIGHPASMSHGSIPREEREKVGIVDGLIRLSVGIEDVEDLIVDLDNALNIV
ncbi:PLP-dependent aspartate aminotransferase family protein [Cellulophaga baltica]|uniref:trans-sulfuration enzyme family protein n=1 Tax=Cellulophaga TaxID=104264 RepID=UPI001C070E10|nr:MULTISPECIES: PLP-dependent aspartate aminotransferase family protein [Cellulophaga]MBU2995703.1 PLP-dependent aspartate aminotransferase family protein [Cellulophaga baltica]MDO6767097.1 PLP-dependent aspartate aminotransferase family protein [Cellulophaga sp. 1_MG-2023]